MKKQIPILFFSLLLCAAASNHDQQDALIPTIKQYNDKLLVIVAPWCDICTKTKKILKNSDVPIAYCNLDRCSQPFLLKHDVIGVPTFLYIKDGQVVHKDVGVKDQSTLFDNVAKLYKTYLND